MDDLISRQAVEDLIMETDPFWCEGMTRAIFEGIKQLPTIDAVPVVRCKDCKHRDAEKGFCEWRGWPMQLVPDDGFCDKGER